MGLLNHLTYDGVDSSSFGVFISGDGVFDAPARRGEMISIPGRNGSLFMDEGVFENITVEGHYVSSVPVLSSGEKHPVYLVEGSFSENQSLAVSDFAPAVPPEGEMIRAASLFVEGYSGSLTVHMRAPSGGTVFLVSSDGTFIPAYSERDGSYIVFTMDNGRSFVYMTEPERHAPVTALMITGGIFVVDAILLIVILSGRKRRKKTTRKKKP